MSALTTAGSGPDDLAAEPARPATKRSIPRAWALALVAAALGMVWKGGASKLADVAIELVMVTLLGLAVVRTPAFISWADQIPSSARRVGKLAVVILLVAQILSIDSTMFPATYWGMYTTPTPSVSVAYDVVGYNAAGDEVAFAPSVFNRTMTTKMGTAQIRRYGEGMHWAQETDDAERLEYSTQKLTEAIDLLASLYNDSSATSIVAVEVFRTTFDAEQREANVGDTEMVWRQDLTTGQGQP